MKIIREAFSFFTVMAICFGIVYAINAFIEIYQYA